MKIKLTDSLEVAGGKIKPPGTVLEVTNRYGNQLIKQKKARKYPNLVEKVFTKSNK